MDNADKNFDYTDCDDQTLLQKYHQCDACAVNELILRYKPLVESMVGYKQPNDRDDLKQEAYLGLLSAIMNYDPKRGVFFSTYARKCIHNKIKNYLVSIHTKKNTLNRNSLPIDDFENLEDVGNAHHTNPERIYIEREAYSLLMNDICRKLSALEKDILLLPLRGFDYKQIASKLQIPQKSVDNALQRVRRKLKSYSL